MKILFTTLFVLFVVTLYAIDPADTGKAQKQPLKRIVIDAGHGGSSREAGKFYGASGKHAEEKDVALAVALKLQAVMHAELPEIEVVMTRITDVFHSPVVKANKANAAKGDLFISLHCNGAPPKQHREIVGYTTTRIKRKGKRITRKIPQYSYWTTPNPAKGTETYIWGVGKTKDKEEALLENSFIDTTIAVYNTLDNPVARMVASIRTNAYAQRSRKLAVTVEEEFVLGGRVSRGAKQRDEKGIWVLQAVAMPAILIELGFLSEPEEEAYITSEAGQQEMAETIVKALKRYKHSLEMQVQGSGGGAK